MALSLERGVRYDMPASFGPSRVPERTEVPRAEALVLSATTDRSAVEALLPSYFSVPEAPVLSVAHMAYHDIDYLGRRSYNEIVVTVSAHHGRGPDELKAAVAIALWVDQPGALLAGREYMGLPKLMGRISDLGPDMRFTCAEYDAVIVEGGARDLEALDADRLGKLNGRAGEVRTFGWKYIAAPGGGSDVDRALVNVMRWDYREAWTGVGDFRFVPPRFEDAPMSCAAAAGLARLPLLSPVRAFRGIGKAAIDRTATRPLPTPL